MRVDYLDVLLRRLSTEGGIQPAGWSAADIEDYRKAVQCVHAAKTPADLLALRSLHLNRTPGDRPGTWSIPLGNGRRLGITFKSDDGEAAAQLEVIGNGTGGKI